MVSNYTAPDHICVQTVQLLEHLALIGFLSKPSQNNYHFLWMQWQKLRLVLFLSINENVTQLASVLVIVNEFLFRHRLILVKKKKKNECWWQNQVFLRTPRLGSCLTAPSLPCERSHSQISQQKKEGGQGMQICDRTSAATPKSYQESSVIIYSWRK